MIYQTEKSLKDYGDKIGADDKAKIEAALKELKEAAKTDNIDDIKAKMETLKQSAYKLAEQMYAANAAKGGANPGAGAQGAGPNPGAGAQGAGPKSGTVDDVDFEVVDDDKK